MEKGALTLSIQNQVCFAATDGKQKHQNIKTVNIVLNLLPGAVIDSRLPGSYSTVLYSKGTLLHCNGILASPSRTKRDLGPYLFPVVDIFLSEETD